MGISPAQEKKLRIAVEFTCELCHEYHPGPSLVIHRISRYLYREMRRDPSARILVICPACHEHVHTLPVPTGRQRALVQKRSFFVRRDLRRILGYRPRPYQPPDDINIPLIYEEYFGRCPQGSYRLGG